MRARLLMGGDSGRMMDGFHSGAMSIPLVQAHSTMCRNGSSQTTPNAFYSSPVRHTRCLPHSRSRSMLDYHDYLERMNTHTYEIVDAAIRHPHIARLDVWGPKWRYWDASVPVSENIRRRMWWIWELEGRRAVREQQAGPGNATDVEAGNQLFAEEYMSRDEMDEWWAVARESVANCPFEGFDLVWTIS